MSTIEVAVKRIIGRRPSAATAIAFIALCLALGGVASAVAPRNSIGTKQLKNDAVIGSKVLADSLDGSDVKESALGTVPKAASADSAKTADSATAAANANSVGGVPVNGLLTVSGCQTGKVLGFAQSILDTSAIPGTYTSGASVLPISGNCSGQSVEVKKVTTGLFEIRFNGNPAALAVGSGSPPPAVTPGTEDTDNSVSAQYGGAPGVFLVKVTDNSGSLENGPFNLIVP